MIEFESPGHDSPHKRRAVFVDRDGVLIANRDNDYVRAVNDIQIIPNSARAVQCLTNAGFIVVVVSNQAVVAKRLMTTRAVRSVHEQVIRCFAAANAELYASYLCTHAAEEGCMCRKPQPGMILWASRRLNIDLSRSYLIGDALSDVAAGEAAGVRSYLVLTGRGAKQARMTDAAYPLADRIFQDLFAAAQAIIALERGK